jgi:hypothetical protein
LSSLIADNTITARPAAGPLTPRADPLKIDMIIPPTIPAMIPENNGAPDASAIPRHNGTATRKTTILEGKSDLKCVKKCSFMIVWLWDF